MKKNEIGVEYEGGPRNGVTEVIGKDACRVHFDILWNDMTLKHRDVYRKTERLTESGDAIFTHDPVLSGEQ